ncbi:MAG: L-lactate permease [Lactobacillaceae bacterium]|jgi:lactate permease|nr:L-lactate permease [Lactobacillaceae bacterium]
MFNLTIASLIIILPLITLTILNMPAIKGMSISSLIVLLTGIFIWKIAPIVIVASVIQAFHKTLTVLWILFGALFLMNFMNKTGSINKITQSFSFLTSDMRLQAVIIAWLFGGLIEGVAGFGTPAIVTAPLLIALGFSSIAGVTLALIGDSTAVIFGAVNTPMNVGLSNLGLSANLTHDIGIKAAMVDIFAGTFIPLVIITITIFVFSSHKSIKRFLEIIPWALLIGLIYTLSELLIASVLGGDFVSIISPIITILVAVITIKFKIFIPKKAWRGAAREEFGEDRDLTQDNGISFFQAVIPYILVIGILFVTRIVPIVKKAVQSVNPGLKNILGVNGIDSSWEILYSPGFILTFATIIAVIIQKQKKEIVLDSAKYAISQIMSSTGITLLVTLIMVQIFSNSQLNSSNLVGMPKYIANSMVNVFGNIWQLFAPLLGGIGSLVTGSGTVSVLTFAPVQYNVAQTSGSDPSLILALQLIGAAAGNMVAIHNIVAVSSVIGLKGKEGKILKNTLLSFLVYISLAGITGIIFSKL